MPQPQDHAGSTDDQPRVPWARRSAAALGWVIGFAVAIGLVVAAVMIPTAFVVNAASADYDLNKQASQIDSFIAAGVQVIMLNAVDVVAIKPFVEKAKAAGIVVAAITAWVTKASGDLANKGTDVGN